MATPCSWELEGEIDEDGLPVVCGRKQYVTFARKVRVMGREVTSKYPRCRRHASDKTIEFAKNEGYTLLWPGPPEEDEPDQQGDPI